MTARQRPTPRTLFAVGMACSMLLFLNMFWDPGEALSFLTIAALPFAAVVIAVLILCGIGRRSAASRRRKGWLLRPLAAACIMTPVLVTCATDLEERLFLLVHERHYRAVIRGEAKAGAREVRRFRDNVVFTIPRMFNYFLVCELADSERSGTVTDPDQQSFWQHHEEMRELAHHVYGAWYSTWYVRD